MIEIFEAGIFVWNASNQELIRRRHGTRGDVPSNAECSCRSYRVRRAIDCTLQATTVANTASIVRPEIIVPASAAP